MSIDARNKPLPDGRVRYICGRLTCPGMLGEAFRLDSGAWWLDWPWGYRADTDGTLHLNSIRRQSAKKVDPAVASLRRLGRSRRLGTVTPPVGNYYLIGANAVLP